MDVWRISEVSQVSVESSRTSSVRHSLRDADENALDR